MANGLMRRKFLDRFIRGGIRVAIGYQVVVAHRRPGPGQEIILGTL